ncbi:MAG: hypothetical protein KF763_02220 [Cyclobacteriaceae bacterium]|nr:hypothetical protein [Cyclobacteriaceae bacterium]
MWRQLTFAALLFGFSVWAQDEVPYKPEAEFEFKFDYSFKERLLQDRADYEAYDPDKKQKSTGPLPYLKTELKLLTLATNEVRLRVINNRGITVINRKASTGTSIKIDWGFSDDVKDQIAAHSYTVLLLDNDKKILSRIVLHADSDGTFLVNGQKRGRL